MQPQRGSLNESRYSIEQLRIEQHLRRPLGGEGERMSNKKHLARKRAADAARRAGRASLLSPAQAVSAVPAGVPCRLSLQRGAFAGPASASCPRGSTNAGRQRPAHHGVEQERVCPLRRMLSVSGLPRGITDSYTSKWLLYVCMYEGTDGVCDTLTPPSTSTGSRAGIETSAGRSYPAAVLSLE